MTAENAASANATTATEPLRARAGDWLEVHGPAGKPSRCGQVLEVLGRAGHEHYRVRWDEKHESIFYPAGGVVILPHAKRHGGRRRATPR